MNIALLDAAALGINAVVASTDDVNLGIEPAAYPSWRDHQISEITNFCKYRAI
jgi:hypothetical protein